MPLSFSRTALSTGSISGGIHVRKVFPSAARQLMDHPLDLRLDSVELTHVEVKHGEKYDRYRTGTEQCFPAEIRAGRHRATEDSCNGSDASGQQAEGDAVGD